MNIQQAALKILHLRQKKTVKIQICISSSNEKGRLEALWKAVDTSQGPLQGYLFERLLFVPWEDTADGMWPGSKAADVWKRVALSPHTHTRTREFEWQFEARVRRKKTSSA